MGKNALVSIGVPDTDELRLQKINRNFQLLFKMASDSNITSVNNSTMVNNEGDFSRHELQDYLTNDTAWNTFVLLSDLNEYLKDFLDTDEFKQLVVEAANKLIGDIGTYTTVSEFVTASITKALQEKIGDLGKDEQGNDYTVVTYVAKQLKDYDATIKKYMEENYEPKQS